MLNRRALAAAALAAAIIVAPALAQEQLFKTVKAAAGKPLRLAVIGNVTRACTLGPMPSVKVLTPPRNGTLAIRAGTAKAGSLRRCPNLDIEIQGIFYQANPRFAGTDEVVYEVSRPDGKTSSFTMRIEVSAQQAPTTGPADDIEL